jgi:hypothetical protein
MCKSCVTEKNYAGSSVNKSASAVPYNRTIYRTVEKCQTTGSGWDKTKNKQKKLKCYILTAGGRGGGEVKNLQLMGKLNL